MEPGILKFKKGQISMEFILLIVVMLLYLQTIIQPLADTSVNSVDDVTRLSQVKLAAEKLVSVVDYVSSQSNESKYSTLLAIPKDANISCNSLTGSVTYRVVMAEQSTNPKCPGFGTGSLCEDSIMFLDSDVGCNLPDIAGPNTYTVSVVKDDSGVVAIASQ